MRIGRIRRISLGVAAFLPAFALAACGGSDDATDDVSAAPEEVTYVTSYGSLGRDAYAYVAEAKGYFADAGIDVTIEPGVGTVGNVKLVASDAAQFSIADFAVLAITLSENPTLKVKATAAIQDNTQAAVMALAESGITEPKDLEGKTLADVAGSQVLFELYANAVGIDPASITFLPIAPAAAPQLLASGRTDAIGQHVTGEATIKAAVGGKDLVVLPYAEALSDLYGVLVIASDDTISSNPELVQRFNAALLKGLAYADQNPEEAAQILKDAVPTTDVAAAAAEIEVISSSLSKSGGVLDEQRVTSLIGDLSPALKSGISADDIADFSYEATE